MEKEVTQRYAEKAQRFTVVFKKEPRIDTN